MAEQNTNQQQEPGTGTQQQGGQMFTQADVNRIVSERLSRQKQEDVDAAEMAEFKKWKASQKTQEQKDAEREAALTAAQNELAQLKAQAKVTAAECRPEFAEFVTAQIMAMEGGASDANIKAYKKDHAQYFGPTVAVRKATGVGLNAGGGSAATTNDIMNSLLRASRGQVEP